MGASKAKALQQMRKLLAEGEALVDSRFGDDRVDLWVRRCEAVLQLVDTKALTSFRMVLGGPVYPNMSPTARQTNWTNRRPQQLNVLRASLEALDLFDDEDVRKLGEINATLGYESAKRRGRR
jgi:hypothetical protein